MTEILTVNGGNIVDDKQRYYDQYLRAEHPVVYRIYATAMNLAGSWQAKRTPFAFPKAVAASVLISVISLPLYFIFPAMDNAYETSKRIKARRAVQQQQDQNAQSVIDRVAALETQVKQLTEKLEGGEHND